MCRRDVPLKSTFCVQKMFFFENLKKKAHNRKKGCLKHSQKRFERFSNTKVFALNLKPSPMHKFKEYRTYELCTGDGTFSYFCVFWWVGWFLSKNLLWKTFYFKLALAGDVERFKLCLFLYSQGNYFFFQSLDFLILLGIVISVFGNEKSTCKLECNDKLWRGS